jgi:menaquinone-dependent protoporphyrinogen oxidase
MIEMNAKIGIVYSTVDGQTLKICNKLREVLQQNNQEVDLISIDDFNEDITKYDKLVIGASIRYGVHNDKVIDFIKKNKRALDSIKTAFFSVNLVARKSEKNTPETNPYVVKFFKTIDWKPTFVEVFAGKLDYKKYSFFDRKMIQLIMWMTKGPTNTEAEIEYTNWEKVNDFALALNKL